MTEQLGFPWGAYDFATGDDVQTNVNDFFKTANPGPTTRMWLDFEDISKSEMSAEQAYQFLIEVSQRLGRACGIYGRNRIREKIPVDDPRWIDMATCSPLRGHPGMAAKSSANEAQILSLRSSLPGRECARS